MAIDSIVISNKVIPDKEDTHQPGFLLTERLCLRQASAEADATRTPTPTTPLNPRWLSGAETTTQGIFIPGNHLTTNNGELINMMVLNKFTRSIAQRFQRLSTLALVATSLVAINPPTAALARPIVVKDGVTFDFQGCARTSDGNDVVCSGIFLSRSGEKQIEITRDNGIRTYITNFRGKTYIATEVLIGEEWSCRNDCAWKYITLVEGVSYRAQFIFRDVLLSPSKIALFSIGSSGSNVGEIKFRNVNVNSSGKLSSDSEVDNVPTASTTDTPSQTTETVASNCPDRSKQFVAGETDSFNIYICGKNRPTQYVGVAKDNGSSIRLKLASVSKGKYVARNGSTAYTVTRNSLKITQNGRVLQTQPLRVSQWRD
jgi:hypothetical protein